MTGDSLPDDMDLLDLRIRTPRQIYVIINGRWTTTTTTTTTTTESPDRYKWMVYDGSKWVLYVLNEFPEHYLRRNRHEGVEITFQTDRPDGLIWFSGNERDNMHLTLRVCGYRVRSIVKTGRNVAQLSFGPQKTLSETVSGVSVLLNLAEMLFGGLLD